MVSVLVLTGFLGSGKTTLLNRLMRARSDWQGKLAIVVNELGDVGIDGDLLPSDVTRQVELPGGCICCVLNEDLDKTLLELIDDNPAIEQVVIETTGVAEPMPIAWTFERAPLSERLRLAAVVTVVDTLEFMGSRGTSPSVDSQVEYADILVLSKTDLGARSGVESVVAELRALNSHAPVLLGTAGEITETLWAAVLDPSL